MAMSTPRAAILLNLNISDATLGHTDAGVHGTENFLKQQRKFILLMARHIPRMAILLQSVSTSLTLNFANKDAGVHETENFLIQQRN